MQGGLNLSVELLETLAQYGLEPALIFADGCLALLDHGLKLQILG
jgi:hypothetical protein